MTSEAYHFAFAIFSKFFLKVEFQNRMVSDFNNAVLFVGEVYSGI